MKNKTRTFQASLPPPRLDPLQTDTIRVDAALDSRGDTLGLDPDANPFLDSRNPTCGASDCTRGFPSGYHPALEYRRQGIDDVRVFFFFFLAELSQTYSLRYFERGR